VAQDTPGRPMLCWPLFNPEVDYAASDRCDLGRLTRRTRRLPDDRFGTDIDRLGARTESIRARVADTRTAQL
jgi:hypothetical protein